MSYFALGFIIAYLLTPNYLFSLDNIPFSKVIYNNKITGQQAAIFTGNDF